MFGCNDRHQGAHCLVLLKLHLLNQLKYIDVFQLIIIYIYFFMGSLKMASKRRNMTL
jgi:hypothetical protein